MHHIEIGDSTEQPIFVTRDRPPVSPDVVFALMVEIVSVADGAVVSMHYTLRNPEQDVLDSSSGGEPMMYLHGAQNIVPGLERKLTGCSVGDQLKVEVAPADGYGERTGPGPQKVPRSAFPDDAELHEGMQVIAQGEGGEMIPLWIVGVDADGISIDGDHPLAGVTLHFDVEIVAIRPATDEEMEHGHPHGPGGHHH